MISQSEHNIKKSALRFLKMYYRHRPRSGETNLKVDQITKDGIIADGLLTFPRGEDKQFVASVEATSFETREEVKYKMQAQLLNWDSLMWGSSIVAILVLFAHYFHWFKFSKGNWTLALGLAVLFTLVFIFYHQFFSKRAKYRYIYALQQFQQYHADEQWVAIGDNIFYGPKDPALEELRKQCVRNGFGLLSVDKELNAHLIISPSREELFGNRRKILSFVGMDKFKNANSMKRAKGWGQKTAKKIGFGKRTNSLLRYQEKHFKPIFTSVLMFCLIGFVAYEDLRQSDYVVIKDETAYDTEIEKVARNNPNDGYDEFDQNIDSAYVAPKRKNTPDSYLAIVEKDKREGFVMKRAPLKKKEELTAKGEAAEIFVESNNKSITSYDCSRFFNFFGKKYIVQDGQFDSQVAAEQRMDMLRRNGIKANLLSLNCFFEDTNDFAVYIEWLYDERQEAIEEGVKYRDLLRRKKLQLEGVIVRGLER
ncbi:MAG: hypothetical protein AAF573_07970 [Bacteroidota bacterium]